MVFCEHSEGYFNQFSINSLLTAHSSLPSLFFSISHLCFLTFLPVLYFPLRISILANLSLPPLLYSPSCLPSWPYPSSSSLPSSSNYPSAPLFSQPYLRFFLPSTTCFPLFLLSPSLRLSLSFSPSFTSDSLSLLHRIFLLSLTLP